MERESMVMTMMELWLDGQVNGDWSDVNDFMPNVLCILGIMECNGNIQVKKYGGKWRFFSNIYL